MFFTSLTSHESKSSLESAVHESKSSPKSLFMQLKCDSSPSRRLEFPSLSISTPIAVGLTTVRVYLLIMFYDLLSVTAGFHKYLQKETIDLVQAVAHKDAVCDSLKEKRSDASAADFHERTLAICSANQNSVEGQSSGHRRKMKGMDEFVVHSPCGSGREDSGSDSEQLKRKLLFPCLDRMIAELER